MNEAIARILELNGIDPQQLIGERTAFQILEAAVLGALDEIEGDA